MNLYSINYFNEKTIGYYGELEDAIKYAESFARNLILTYRGSIVISTGGYVVATQRWEEKDGCSYPDGWERSPC